ncbi:trypsin-like serine peptidase [Bradyrhizobium genosp. P]|uniref:trypsin-like serine peptidase n=1 Tax=Bradyrhizobium genosp. P TaxID=83641 RepID=UPI003CF579B7
MENPLSSQQVKSALKSHPASKPADVKISFERQLVPPKPGVRVFPDPIKGTILQRPAKSDAAAADIEKKLVGFVPDHLAFNPHVPALEQRFQHKAFFDPAAVLKKGQYMATTVFQPDQRRVFSDTSFPWCTVGRVDVTGGTGSGVLIGPRHLLCASHMMTWNPDNTVNQVTFTPSYFDGNAPFGNSGIIHWYAFRKVVGPNLNVDDTQQDYVVLVLNNRLGDVCGWMGTRGYSDSWNGLTAWSHIGYPGDLTGAARPTFQGNIAINGTEGSDDPTDEGLLQKADVWPGQSGGPFFGWWSGEPWPRVTGVQSGQNAITNTAGGGNDIPILVNQARSDFP